MAKVERVLKLIISDSPSWFGLSDSPLMLVNKLTHCLGREIPRVERVQWFFFGIYMMRSYDFVSVIRRWFLAALTNIHICEFAHKMIPCHAYILLFYIRGDFSPLKWICMFFLECNSFWCFAMCVLSFILQKLVHA